MLPPAPAGHAWVLDFTDGGETQGVLMSQHRMREIQRVVDPISATTDILADIGMVNVGATSSWVDLLVCKPSTFQPSSLSVFDVVISNLSSRLTSLQPREPSLQSTIPQFMYAIIDISFRFDLLKACPDAALTVVASSTTSSPSPGSARTGFPSCARARTHSERNLDHS
jgi:hypothetical protein